MAPEKPHWFSIQVLNTHGLEHLIEHTTYKQLQMPSARAL